MKDLIRLLFVTAILTSCTFIPKIKTIADMPLPVAYQTKHGINVYCDGVWKIDEADGMTHYVNSGCYSQEEVEIAIDSVIDELVWRRLGPYTYNSVRNFLNETKGFHDIYFKEVEKSEEKSCKKKTKKNPDGYCTGFVCGSVSTNGWCHGLHSTQKTCEGNDCVENSIMRVAKNDICIGKISLVHELIHFFQYHIEQHSDYAHEDEMLWPRSCTVEKYPNKSDRKECKSATMISEVNRYMRNQVCVSK